MTCRELFGISTFNIYMQLDHSIYGASFSDNDNDNEDDLSSSHQVEIVHRLTHTKIMFPFPSVVHLMFSAVAVILGWERNV
jgi:hypothetical protein